MFKEKYDIIIIGGGATGSGIALDATLRGYNCILFEKNDFAEGTSGRSTKLAHGGVRYLEAALMKLNLAQFSLVREGLKERFRLLNNASHLAHSITLVTPLYKWYEIPYMYAGLALYDLVSGSKRLGRSQIVSKKEILEKFTVVKKEGLKGGVRYFDGFFNDTRMVVSLLQSAKEEGCDVKNHHEVIELLYDEEKISGAKVKNKLTHQVVEVKSEFIINATGPFSDTIRKIDDKDIKEIVKVSSGIHIVLDKKFLPNDEGLMIPKTEDGRVLFMLPYMGKCLVGTTDEVASLNEHPHVNAQDIEYLLRHIKKYFSQDITRDDILSSWSGLRPLVVQENVSNTKELVREHYIGQSKSGLISIVGGKWTTYRKMAEDVVDLLLNLTKKKNLHTCLTKNYKLVGSSENLIKIKEKLGKLKLENSIIEHIFETYGDQALHVVRYINKYGVKKLHKKYPYLEAEVHYSITYEFVCKPLDFLVRRVGLGLIDTEAAKSCLEVVTSILKDELSWDDETYEKEFQKAKLLLNEGI